jgi:hypothetical protein
MRSAESVWPQPHLAWRSRESRSWHWWSPPPIQVGPLAGDPAVGLVDRPRPVRVPEFRSAAAVQFWRPPLDPTPDRYVIHTDVRLGHDLFQLSKAKGIPQVLADTAQ